MLFRRPESQQQLGPIHWTGRWMHRACQWKDEEEYARPTHCFLGGVGVLMVPLKERHWQMKLVLHQWVPTVPTLPTFPSFPTLMGLERRARRRGEEDAKMPPVRKGLVGEDPKCTCPQRSCLCCNRDLPGARRSWPMLQQSKLSKG